jgi:hypothetical protein
MSQLLIQQYLNELSDLRRVSGTNRELVVREAFKTLLKDAGRAHDLIFIPEYEYITVAKERRYVDGALLHELRVPFGYWEAKDEKDNLDAEIEYKFRRGYPQGQHHLRGLAGSGVRTIIRVSGRSMTSEHFRLSTSIA